MLTVNIEYSKRCVSASRRSSSHAEGEHDIKIKMKRKAKSKDRDALHRIYNLQQNDDLIEIMPPPKQQTPTNKPTVISRTAAVEKQYFRS